MKIKTTPAIERGITALGALTERANLAGVRLGYTSIVTGVLPAALDVEELASGPLFDHWPLSGDYQCKCGVVTGDPAEFTRHQARAVRASILGEP